MPKSPENFEPSQAEQDIINKSRTISDADFLERGAEYKNGILTPTDYQVEKEKKEMEDVLYRKKMQNEKQDYYLIKEKIRDKLLLTEEEVKFLYASELAKHWGSYGLDFPNIWEIRKLRGRVKEDASIVLECEINQIATEINEVNQETKVCIGEWCVDIFKNIKKYPNIIHFYRNFPYELTTQVKNGNMLDIIEAD